MGWIFIYFLQKEIIFHGLLEIFFKGRIKLSQAENSLFLRVKILFFTEKNT